MIGTIVTATLLAASAPQPAAPTEAVRSFVAALLTGAPANNLPYASPALRIDVNGRTDQRPEIGKTLASVEAALKACALTRVDDLGGEPQHGYTYEVWLKCQDDDKDDSKTLRLFVDMRGGAIERVTLTIANLPLPPVVMAESAEHLAARQRDEAVARAYFGRLGAGEITQEHAPKSGVIMRTKGVFETPSLEWLKRIFAGCEMQQFRNVSLLSLNGPTKEYFITEWKCPVGAPDPAPTAAFRIVGTDIDEVRVVYSTARGVQGD